MELKWLEDFIALVEEKSITRAATRRNVTQPAFSRRIRQLEQWLGAEIVDRSIKPIGIRPTGHSLEEGVRDLVNRFYALRNKVHENQDKITFVVQHTLAVSYFPKMMREVKTRLPETSFRVIPVNNNDCEVQFLKEGEILLCYQTPEAPIEFDHRSTEKISLGFDQLIPVASRELCARLGEPVAGMKLPLLTYQEGGFLADCLANSCMPRVIRDYRAEIICESAFSVSLKEMALGGMGIAWLAGELIKTELEQGELQSLQASLGHADLEIVLFIDRDAHSNRAQQVFEIFQH
ncbi:MAG: DNA-binding transcriptional LysR family regulator [Planctomycetota bacterium]|jgi:DNA-binding transcriptional LysR family regulator